MFTPPVVSKAEGPIAHADDGGAGGGDELARRLVRSRDAHVLTSRSQSAGRERSASCRRRAGTADVRITRARCCRARRTGGRARRRDRAGRRRRRRGRRVSTFRGCRSSSRRTAASRAIDLDKGDIRWQVPHGETPDNIRNHPALKGLTIPRTGRPGIVGTLVTKTLLIAGEPGFGPTPSGQRGAMLRAYDKATGKEVGAVYMPAPQTRIADDLHAERQAVHRRRRSAAATIRASCWHSSWPSNNAHHWTNATTKSRKG